MPQIDAPTVAEHRAQQREALLDAAEAILLESGHGALTFRALGERTGLARNSIYRYFASRDDLIAALCERDMPRWLEELEAAMAAADGPGRAGGRVRLHAAAAGRPRQPPDGRAARRRAARPGGARAHQRARLPARVAARARARPDDPKLVAQLVQGVVNAGVRLLHGAGTLEQVEPLTVTLAQTLVRSRAR